MRQLCVHRDMKHLGSMESTQEARVAFGYTSSNSYASFVLSKLPLQGFQGQSNKPLRNKNFKYYITSELAGARPASYFTSVANELNLGLRKNNSSWWSEQDLSSFFSCSARTKEGVQLAFEELVEKVKQLMYILP